MRLFKKGLIVISTIGVGIGLIAVLKKPDSVYKNRPNEKNPMEGKKVRFVEDKNEKENADGGRGHLEAVDVNEHRAGFYEKYIKRIFDVILSFCGLVILSPVFLMLSLWIVIDDPGPVLFTQKRIGRNKQYFKLHKFRSMKMNTPHNVPTHMLDNPEQYITKAGKFMRKHSLEGNDIIGQTTESLVNKGFREVSPIHFFTGRDLISKRTDLIDIEGGMNLLAVNQGQEAFRVA